MFTPMPSDGLLMPDWPAPPGIRALVTTRALPGNSLPPYDAFNLGLRSGEDEATVQANRALLIRALNMPSPPRWLRQVHGTGVITFGCEPPPQPPRLKSASYVEQDEEVFRVDEPVADAAITREPGIVLAILTADCLPILLCSEDGREIAAIHAGWHGMAAGVIEACVGQMRAPPTSLLAWLGPAVAPMSYEVGAEVRAAFVESDAGAGAAFEATRPGHWSCDLYALARRRLGAAGIGRIHGGGLDTRTDPRFYSYRRDRNCSGRFASLIHIE